MNCHFLGAYPIAPFLDSEVWSFFNGLNSESRPISRKTASDNVGFVEDKLDSRDRSIQPALSLQLVMNPFRLFLSPDFRVLLLPQLQFTLFLDQ